MGAAGFVVDGTPGASRPEDLPSLTVLCRSLALLVGVGASVGLGGWALRIGPPLVGYVTSNALPAPARSLVLKNMAGGAVAALLVGGAVFAIRSGARLESLRRLSLRLSPLLLAWLLPLLFNWEIWQGKDLPFLALVALGGVGTQRLLRVALLTPDVFPGLRAPAWPGRLGAWLGRAPGARFVPLLVVCLGAAGYAAFFAFHTLRNHYRLSTAALDLGLENNLVWNASHFARPLFKSSPLGGPHMSHGGFHQTYFAYVLGLPYRLAPGPEILLIIQAIFCGIAAVPLYFLARRRLTAWLSCLIACLYLLYAPLQGANLYDFHYLPLGTFFLWTTLNLFEARRYGWAVVAVLFTMSVREDVSALLAVIGAYLVLSDRRPLPGLVVATVGVAYFVALKMFIMPRFLAGSEAFIEMFRDLLPEGDRGYGGVLKTVIGNPGFTMGALLERDKLIYLLQIMAPLAFFPWLRPLGLLCMVPGFFFTLISTKYPPLIQASFQYTTYWTVFLFIAVVANLGWLVDREQRAPEEAAEWRARRHAWVAAIVLSMLATSYQFGALLQQHTARGGFGPYRFDLTAADHQRHARLYSLIAQVPPRAKIVSSELIVPHVSNRPDSYTLRTGMYDAEYLLAWMPLRGDERPAAVAAIKSGKFGVIDEQGEFLLAKRGYPTARNAGVISHYHL
jgi:uncharacterized membrane protein